MQWWTVLWVLPMIAWFIIAILIAVWVYRDAEKRGESGALWLIIVLITGIIGLIIWLIIRRDKPVVS
jgi:TctA family transporter